MTAPASPWEGYDDGIKFVGDHIYAGNREEIRDLFLLYETVLEFEIWVGDFRREDILYGEIPASLWEKRSPFSETKSIQMSQRSNNP